MLYIVLSIIQFIISYSNVPYVCETMLQSKLRINNIFLTNRYHFKYVVECQYAENDFHILYIQLLRVASNDKNRYNMDVIGKIRTVMEIEFHPTNFS